MKPLTLILAFLPLIAVLGFTLGKNDDRWPATWGGACASASSSGCHPGADPGTPPADCPRRCSAW